MQKSLRVKQAVDAHRVLNRRFWSLDLLDSRFYEQLVSRGCDVGRCVLVGLSPDGDETYVGTLIRQDGRVFDFDLALLDPDCSEWEDKTEEFLSGFEKVATSKPWTPDVVAYRAFVEEQ